MTAPFAWARVDDRLIHGQVVVAWRQHLRYDAICVVDDVVGNDPFLQDALRLATPAGLPLRVYTVAQAAGALPVPSQGRASGSGRALLLVKRPQVALALVEGGVPLPQLNVGCLSSAPGSVRVFRSISLTREHAAALDALAARGVRITFQLTPDDPQADWETVRRRHFQR